MITSLQHKPARINIRQIKMKTKPITKEARHTKYQLSIILIYCTPYSIVFVHA